MKSKFLNLAIFILSGFCLFISIELFYTTTIFSNEFNISPDVILGGKFPLFMNWARIVVTLSICGFSGFNFFKAIKE